MSSLQDKKRIAATKTIKADMVKEDTEDTVEVEVDTVREDMVGVTRPPQSTPELECFENFLDLLSVQTRSYN